MDEIMEEIKKIINDEYHRGYHEGYTDGRKLASALESTNNSIYTAGDLYWALRIIGDDEKKGGLEIDDIRGLFGTVIMYDILEQNTPETIVEKVRNYLHEQKQEKEQEQQEYKHGDEIKCGDEVYIVTNCESNLIYAISDSGRTEIISKKDAQKTGKHYQLMARRIKDETVSD